MHFNFVVFVTRRFVKIIRHLYCYRRCCNIYITYIFRCYCYPFSFPFIIFIIIIFLFFFKVELYILIHLFHLVYGGDETETRKAGGEDGGKNLWRR